MSFSSIRGIVNSYGVFQTYYENEMLVYRTSSEIAWIGSIQVFLLLFIGALTGPLYDSGYFRLLLATGTFLMCLGMMMISICTEYWQFVLAQGIVVGVGAGCLFIPSVAVLPLYFSSHLAFSIGVAGSGSGVGELNPTSCDAIKRSQKLTVSCGLTGGIIYSIAFQQLQKSIGFGWASRVMGFISLVTLVFPLLIMRVRSSNPKQKRKVRKLFDSSALRELPFCLFLVWGFFGFAGVYMPLYYVGSYAIETKIMPPALAFYLIPILNAGSVIGRTVPNVSPSNPPLHQFVSFLLLLLSRSLSFKVTSRHELIR